MEYVPKYSQPFTLEHAIRLDVAIIAEEISRLQNSLVHLRTTQETLRNYISSEASATSGPDPELTKALEENEVVIGSQEERISVLRMALSHKGIPSSTHYDPDSVVAPSPMEVERIQPAASTPNAQGAPSDAVSIDQEGGLDL